MFVWKCRNISVPAFCCNPSSEMDYAVAAPKVSLYCSSPSFTHLLVIFRKNVYGNSTPPKLKNGSRLMVPPVLQGLISLFPPLNSVGLCVVWQWLVHLVLPAWHILKVTHELTWERFTAERWTADALALSLLPTEGKPSDTFFHVEFML